MATVGVKGLTVSNDLVLVLGLFHLAAEQCLVADTRLLRCRVDDEVASPDADVTHLVHEIRNQ